MIRCKINPILMEQGILKIKKSKAESFNIQSRQTFIGISKINMKEYSFCVMINSIQYLDEQNSDIEIAQLDIDSRRIGNLQMDDEIELHPIKTRNAEKVVVYLPEQEYSSISPGDWTYLLSKQFSNKFVDLGDNLSGAIQMDVNGVKSVMLLKGIVVETFPESPVLINENTKIELKKSNSNDYGLLIKSIEKNKKERVAKFQDEIKSESVIAINNLKRLIDEKIEETGEFRCVDVSKFNLAINSLFSSYQQVKREENSDKRGQIFSNTFIKFKQQKPVEYINCNLIGSSNYCQLFLDVTTESIENSNNISTNLMNKIKRVYLGLSSEEKIQKMCPTCNSPLPIDAIGDDGTVVCEHCGTVVKIR